MPVGQSQTGRASDFNPYYTAGEAIAANDAVALNYSDNKVYKASASAFDYRLNFIGFAVAAAASGAACPVNTQPIVTLSGLTANTKYYLSNTQGAISTSAGTKPREIGIALSTTQLIRPKNGARVSTPLSVSQSFTSPVNGTVNCLANGAEISVNSVVASGSTGVTPVYNADATVKPGDVISIAVYGGGSPYGGPLFIILDV